MILVTVLADKLFGYFFLDEDIPSSSLNRFETLGFRYFFQNFSDLLVGLSLLIESKKPYVFIFILLDFTELLFDELLSIKLGQFR